MLEKHFAKLVGTSNAQYYKSYTTDPALIKVRLLLPLIVAATEDERTFLEYGKQVTFGMDVFRQIIERLQSEIIERDAKLAELEGKGTDVNSLLLLSSQKHQVPMRIKELQTQEPIGFLSKLHIKIRSIFA